MSVPYRFKDGSFGRIIFNIPALRKQMSHLSFSESSISVEEKYTEITESCNCQLLTVSDNCLAYFSKVSDISKYLFGVTAEELCTPNNPENRYSSYPEAIAWDKSKISTMNWDMFLLALYLFIFSESEFSSFYWKQLKQIIQGIQSDDNLFKRVAFGKTKNFYEDANTFWNKTYEELGKKVLRMCSAQTCWLAFQGLKEIKETFSIIEHEQYVELEKKFCTLMDGIAIEKLLYDDRDKIEYLTIDALDINNIFFYDEYFELESVDLSAKKEIYKLAFERFLWAADWLRDRNQNYIAADKMYDKALQYANAEKASLIKSRRENNRAFILKQRKLDKKNKIKNAAKSIFELIMVIGVIAGAIIGVIFTVLTLISLVFSLNGLFDVSWVGMVICFSITAASVLALKLVFPGYSFKV